MKKNFGLLAYMTILAIGLAFCSSAAIAAERSQAADSYVLHKVFKDNPFAAEEKFKGQRIVVKGPVKKIGRGFGGQPEISIEGNKGNPFDTFECEFDLSLASTIAKVNKGDTIYLDCILKKASGAVVRLTDCKFVDD